MSRRLDRGHRVVPGKMGRDWNEFGPKVRSHSLKGTTPLLTICSAFVKNTIGFGKRLIGLPKIAEKVCRTMLMSTKIS